MTLEAYETRTNWLKNVIRRTSFVLPRILVSFSRTVIKVSFVKRKESWFHSFVIKAMRKRTQRTPMTNLWSVNPISRTPYASYRVRIGCCAKKPQFRKANLLPCDSTSSAYKKTSVIDSQRASQRAEYGTFGLGRAGDKKLRSRRQLMFVQSCCERNGECQCFLCQCLIWQSLRMENWQH